ncbi:MAG: phosphoribosylaminoimidazole carboxylase [Gammaproteobacteria bacterium SG8_15]|nr:MAG: phosphoribosylaminoimidazole carboxylase [Gammaproteobacteria bacterium SG8_15]
MRIGVLGGGQLGRMLALAGYPLGLEFVFYDHNPQACAAALGTLVLGEFDDTEKLTAFAQQVDLVTVEFENIPLAALEHVAQFVPVYPGPRAVSAAQDRLDEKQLFQSLGIPTPEFYTADNAESLADTLASHNETLIVKSRRFGYDGKGQLVLDSATAASKAWETLGGVPLIAEQRMQFQREVSIIVVRSRSGETGFYPLTENLHKQGILRRSQVSVHDPLQAMAEDYAQRVLAELDYVGVLAFEFFDCNGELVANEIAPRVHNSGHWTIEGAATSQFENHLRAILDWPLGDTSVRARCVMYNVIGEMPDPASLLKVPDIHLHYYGKAPRPGRKLGHITLWGSTEENALAVEKMLDA